MAKKRGGGKTVATFTAGGCPRRAYGKSVKTRGGGRAIRYYVQKLDPKCGRKKSRKSKKGRKKGRR